MCPFFAEKRRRVSNLMFDAHSASMARKETRAAVEAIDVSYGGYLVVHEVEGASQQPAS